jgi:hypothetical protein
VADSSALFYRGPGFDYRPRDLSYRFKCFKRFPTYYRKILRRYNFYHVMTYSFTFSRIHNSQFSPAKPCSLHRWESIVKQTTYDKYLDLSSVAHAHSRELQERRRVPDVPKPKHDTIKVYKRTGVQAPRIHTGQPDSLSLTYVVEAGPAGRGTRWLMAFVILPRHST